jgi:hypothetical protein
MVYPVDGPTRNTCSQTQAHTKTHEAVLACIHNYGKVTSRPVKACHAALRQYPSNMLHAVLDKATGHLREMQHLLMNPKSRNCGANPTQRNLGVLLKACPESANVPTLSF